MTDASIYYSDPKVQKRLLEFAKDREVVGSFKDGSFSSRPDTLVYPNDVLERIKKGIAAFHCSVEKWNNPMQLKTELTNNELNEIRKGFDFIIDIDAKSKIEHAQIAAICVYEFLKSYGIEPTVKFSGSRGFHIGIAGNAFPTSIDFRKTSVRYPEIPQTLANFIREKIKDKILDELIKFEGGVSSLVNTVENISELSPYQFIDIEKNWGNRHLFRMPYSLHVKKGLVSAPLTFEQLKNFKFEMADPKNVDYNAKFLVNKDGEATKLMLDALDAAAKIKPEVITKQEVRPRAKIKISENYFPPCIKTILSGEMNDGRKRSLYTIASFLRAMNWTQEEIEKRIMEWNANLSKGPLTDRTIRTQLKWHFRQSREMMPANCESDAFYKSIGVCKPDENCSKNPVNYPFNSYKKNKKLRYK
ncbi:MAG: hypothetical protein PHU12_01430 [Candidatus Aenigmarchaeota archaeon]|nr:hypothetical protein [Candidatus Aenigmarchaeota archaeon]